MSADERARGVIAFLSGNHAQGVAHAARICGTAATIIMSEDAPKLKLANIHAPTVPRSSPVTGSVKAERKSTAKSPSEIAERTRRCGGAGDGPGRSVARRRQDNGRHRVRRQCGSGRFSGRLADATPASKAAR